MTSPFNSNPSKNDLVLGALAGKVVDPTDIARTEKALIHVNNGTLYFPVLYEGVEVGGIFIGTGQVLVDAIVNTKRGALGRSHEFLWNGSLFLLTEDGKWSPPSVASVKEKELKAFHLKSPENALKRAQQIFNNFINRKLCWATDTFIQKRKGWIASILDKEHGECHIFASENRLVFKIDDAHIVIHGNKLVQSIGRHKFVVTGPGGGILRFG